MRSSHKIAILFLILLASAGGAYFWTKAQRKSDLTFSNHNPLRSGMKDSDFKELMSIHQDCFDESRRQNLIRYFIKYQSLDKMLAERRANQAMQEAKEDAEERFAKTINAFVVREDNKLLGMFNCRYEDQVTAGSMMIFNVCVRKDKRGQGYGERIMAHAIEQCKKPAQDLTLMVYKDDTKVVNFYKNLNFKIISELNEWDQQFSYFNRYLMKYEATVTP